MPETISELQLRPATLDDASIVADLDTLRDPDDPRDPVLLRHWWRMTDEMEQVMRRVAVRDGNAIAFVGAAHERWNEDEKRYGTVRASLHPKMWDDSLYAQLVGLAEEWLQDEGAATSVARVRDDFKLEIAALERLGYRVLLRLWLSEHYLASPRSELH